MKIEELRELLKKNTRNFADKEISIEGINTQEDVDQLIEILANDSLKIARLNSERLNIKFNDDQHNLSYSFWIKFINKTQPIPEYSKLISNTNVVLLLPLVSARDESIFRAVSGLQGGRLTNIKENLVEELKCSINNSLGSGIASHSLPVFDELQGKFIIATRNEEFNNSEQAANITNLINYYASQHRLIAALSENFYQKASPHDEPILRKLREDLLNQLKTVAGTLDENEWAQLQRMLAQCEQASGQVKDKSGDALIKNVMLMLSAILTAGISLGIYAAVTRQTRAEKGSFFFKDTEFSKNKIDKVKKNLEDVQTEVKRTNQ